MPDIKVIQLSDLRMDATQVRRATSEEPIARYIERYKHKESMDPIDVCFDGTTYWLADGFHRVAAVTRMGGKSMRATIHEGGRTEAWRMGCEKNNRHGLPRSNEDKRYAVGVCLDDAEWREWSDRAIADHCAVSDRLVNKMRAEASGANGSHLKPAPDAQNADSAPSETPARKGKDGKKYPAKQSKTPPKSEPVTEESGGTDAPPAEVPQRKSGQERVGTKDRKDAAKALGVLIRALDKIGVGLDMAEHTRAIDKAIREA